MRLFELIGIIAWTVLEFCFLLCVVTQSLSRVINPEPLTNQSESTIAGVILQQLDERGKQLTFQNTSSNHKWKQNSHPPKLNVQGNLHRAFFCASLAFCCFGTCCAVHKYRWKERKHGCPRDSTQIQFLEEEEEEEEENLVDALTNGQENQPQLNQSEERQSLQEEEENLIYDFPFFEADIFDETSKEFPLRKMESEKTSVFYNTTVHITHL